MYGIICIIINNYTKQHMLCHGCTIGNGHWGSIASKEQSPFTTFQQSRMNLLYHSQPSGKDEVLLGSTNSKHHAAQSSEFQSQVARKRKKNSE